MARASVKLLGCEMISIAESLLNAVIGLCVSLALTHYWLGFPVVQSAGITAVFFAASFVRAFVIREVFRKWQS